MEKISDQNQSSTYEDYDFQFFSRSQPKKQCIPIKNWTYQSSRKIIKQCQNDVHINVAGLRSSIQEIWGTEVAETKLC